MKHFGSAALVALGILALGASSASAAVVCNEAGDCWRTKGKFRYPPEARVHVYADDYAIDTKKYRLRDPGPRPGYYSRGNWVESPIEQELQEENE